MLAEAMGKQGEVAATDPRLLPTSTVYVHIAEQTLLHGEGVARIEGAGPLCATMLKHLVGHSRIRLTPVLDTGADMAVDSYEIPRPIREQVIVRDGHEVFPFSSRAARQQDLDHTDPYRPGVPRQTRTGNLGPLSRKAHRAKTFGRWRLEQPKPGVFWWRSEAGYVYRVSPQGTVRISGNPKIGRSVRCCGSWTTGRMIHSGYRVTPRPGAGPPVADRVRRRESAPQPEWR